MKIIRNSRYAQAFTYNITVIFSMGLSVIVLPKQSLIENNVKKNRKKMLICSSYSLLRSISGDRKITSHLLFIKGTAKIKHYVLPR